MSGEESYKLCSSSSEIANKYYCYLKGFREKIPLKLKNKISVAVESFKISARFNIYINTHIFFIEAELSYNIVIQNFYTLYSL